MAEMSAAIVGAFLGAVASAILLYWVWTRQRRTELTEQRTRLATALLVELRSTDYVLRKIYENERAALSGGEIPLAILDRLDRELLCFEPQTVYELLTFRGFCRDVQLLRTSAQRLAPDKVGPFRHHRVRVKAAAAIGLLPTIKAALVSEGGLVMPRKAIAIIPLSELPRIPESPFHHDDSDEDAQGDGGA